MRVSTIGSLASKTVTVAVAVLFLGTLSAEARPDHTRLGNEASPVATTCVFFCSQDGGAGKAQGRRPDAEHGSSSSLGAQQAYVRGTDTIVGGRPAGCPSRWCGCQASLEIFGRIVPFLNLASHWLIAFQHVPRASAAPDMAAARGGHVVVLKRHVDGNRWVVKDGNWGGKIHIRETDISSYTVVDPHSGKLAMN